MRRRLIDATKLEEIYSKNSITDIVTVRDKTVMQHLKDAQTIDAVELPCKIGDTVYIARRYKCHKRPRKGVVSEMFFNDDMTLQIVVKGVARGKWGVDVFATYEEAEAQIERNNRKD